MDTNVLAQSWDQVKGRLQEIWQDLTDADLEKVKGRMDNAVNYLQTKYGQSKEVIEDKLYTLLEDEDGYGEEE